MWPPERQHQNIPSTPRNGDQHERNSPARVAPNCLGHSNRAMTKGERCGARSEPSTSAQSLCLHQSLCLGIDGLQRPPPFRPLGRSISRMVFFNHSQVWGPHSKNSKGSGKLNSRLDHELPVKVECFPEPKWHPSSSPGPFGDLYVYTYRSPP